MKNRTRLIIIIGVIILVAGCTFSFLLNMLFFGGTGGASNRSHANFGPEQAEIVSLSAFSSLSIDLSEAEITLTPGDSFSLDYYFRDSRQLFHYEEKNGALRIWDTKSKPFVGSFYSGFSGIGWFGGNNGNTRTNHVKITYPGHTDLEKLFVDCAFGNVQVSSLMADQSEIALSCGNLTLDSLSVGSFQAENSFGDVTLQDVKSESLFKVDLSSGQMNISAATGEKFELFNSFGRITLSDITAKELISELSSGDLTVTNATADRISFSNNFGRIQGSGLVSKEELVATNSSGSLDLQGDLLGKITADATFGDVDIRLSGAKNDYSYSLETSFGMVSLDNEKFANSGGSKVAYTAGANFIDVGCSSGNVTVSFSQSR